MNRLLRYPWTPSIFVLVSVPLITFLALPAPPWLEWLAALFGLSMLLLMGLSRRQVLAESIMVLLAGAAAEFLFAPFLGWYAYAEWPVPPWVPVGHGLVWMAARTMPLGSVSRSFLAAILIAAQFLWMTLHMQLDVVGLIFLAVLLLALFSGLRGARFIAALALLVWWVEIWGAALFSVWAWSPTVLGLPEISPPGSAAGGYLLLLETPALLIFFWLSRFRTPGRFISRLAWLGSVL